MSEWLARSVGFTLPSVREQVTQRPFRIYSVLGHTFHPSSMPTAETEVCERDFGYTLAHVVSCHSAFYFLGYRVAPVPAWTVGVPNTSISIETPSTVVASLSIDGAVYYLHSCSKLNIEEGILRWLWFAN